MPLIDLLYKLGVTIGKENLHNNLLNYRYIFSHLYCRSLDNNKIRTISREAFRPLRSLRKLDMKGNRYSILPSFILSLPVLKIMTMDTDCASCEINFLSYCSLEQKNRQSKVPAFGNVSGLCLMVNCTSTARKRALESWNSFKSRDTRGTQYRGFSETQANVSSQNTTELVLAHLSLLQQNISLDIFIFILSLTAVTVNILVLTVLFTDPSLYRTKSMILGGNIAVCDLFVASYLLTIAVNNKRTPDTKHTDHDDSWEMFVCPTIKSIRSVAMTMEPICLFIMTLDRFKVIVNQFRPLAHLTYRSVVSTVAFAWLGSLAIVIFAAVFEKNAKTKGYLCWRSISQKSISFYLEQIIISVDLMLLVSCCVLYFRIYRSVKSTNLCVGGRTYIRVSKHIAALIISTFVLWFVPAIAVVIFARKNPSAKEVRTLIMLICFTANSAINPFLYVFRDRKFQIAFFSLCCRKTCRPNLDRDFIKPRKGTESAVTVSKQATLYFEGQSEKTYNTSF